ncbi:hypothetical protein EDC96DRAFT_496296 [Choanephora cucurbitarum]|nr:hypothetical protein EDC96DRAFT_496296 [Choanephora cucurbitarum]
MNSLASSPSITSLTSRPAAVNDTREKMVERRNKLFQDSQERLLDQLKSLHVQLDKQKNEQAQIEQQLASSKESNQKLRKEVHQLQNQLYETTKPIRVTDDDYSTIIAQLNKFIGKVNNFPPNAKSHFNQANRSKEEVTQFFCQLWQEDQQEIEILFQQESQPTDKLDYSLISNLIERYLIDRTLKHVLTADKIHLDSSLNACYAKIDSLYRKTGHQDWANDLRLKTAKATAELIHINDAETLEATQATKEAIVQDILSTLLFLFDTSQEDIKKRVEKIVDMAAELSLPIHGQEDAIEIYDLKKGDPIKQAQVKHTYRQLNRETVLLSISPVFLAKSTVENEDDINPDTYIEHYTLVYPGKAIW